MTDKELANKYFEELTEKHIPITIPNINREIKNAFIAGLKAGKKCYSKIYMLGRKDERERPCDLCNNPINICKRCDCYPCEGSDTGAYIGTCKDFIYKEGKE